MQPFIGRKIVDEVDEEIGVTRLDFPDKDGRNWSRSLVLDAAGVAPEIYSLAYGAVIGTAHETWNLK